MGEGEGEGESEEADGEIELVSVGMEGESDMAKAKYEAAKRASRCFKSAPALPSPCLRYPNENPLLLPPVALFKFGLALSFILWKLRL